MQVARAMKTWTISSESESSALATLVDTDSLPGGLPEEVLGLAFNPEAFSSCSLLSLQHSEMSCPFCLQCKHFFTFPGFLAPLLL